jgi:Asp-tRNA(Asn)/Glu-tRNA(Gln) amidotransferase A subunit family amidase
VDELFEEAIADMGDAGAEIVDDLEFERPDGFSQATYDLLLYEFKHDLNAYLAGLPDDKLSGLTLEKLIAFNEEHADEEMPWFGQEIFEKAQAKGSLDEEAYREALNLSQQATRQDGIDRLIAEHDLDALIAPTGAPAWKIDRINGDHFIGGSSTYPAVAGYPNFTMPMGDVHGLPVGLSIFGPRLSEPVLIEIASGYEHVAGR